MNKKLIIVLSPTKTMKEVPYNQKTTPVFLSHAITKMNGMKHYTVSELEKEMKISPKLAITVINYIQTFGQSQGGAALLTYSGMSFKEIRADGLDNSDLSFAQDHVRMLSALYGVVRPLDHIHCYRLDMETGTGGKALYHYWSQLVHDELFQETPIICNLSSGEYSKMVTPYLTDTDECITCKFTSRETGKPITHSTALKKLRGQMAKCIIKNRINTLDGLKNMGDFGFAYDPMSSMDGQYVFLV